MTQPVYRRALPLIGSLLVALLALSLVASPAAEAAAARPAAPTGMKVVKRNFTNAEIKWQRSAHASTYQVVAATDRTMKHVVFRSKTAATYRWISGKKIKEGHAYYVQLQAFNGSKAGRKSAVHRVVLAARQARYARKIVTRPVSTTSLKVSWEKALYATEYIVSFSAKLNSAAVFRTYVPAPRTSVVVQHIDLAKLGLSHAFFVTVTSDRFRRTFASNTTAAALPYPAAGVSASASRGTFTLNVGSYNVRQSSFPTPAYPVSAWPKRAQAVGANIERMNVGIIGVQESNWGLEHGARPIQQIANAAGLKVAMNGSQPCAQSGGVNLLYNANTVTLGACGWAKLASGLTRGCCATWGLFTDKATGGKVLVATTHLVVGYTAALDKKRAAETENLIKLLSGVQARYGVPLLVVGDFNSNYGRATTTPMALFAQHKMLGADLTAETATNILSHSAHGFKATTPNGLRIDHIFMSPGVETKHFAVDVSNPRTAPSDHFPIQATVKIPVV